MNYSYWEYKEWFSNIDFTIVGSGIVGLNCALELRKKHPKAKILILEKGILPQGASTKNAGFACFGSLSEIIDDLNTHSEEEVYNLVEKRWNGLQLLRKNLGDSNIDFQQNFGYELFNDKQFFEECLAQKENINKLLKPIFNADVFLVEEYKFGFKNVLPNHFVNIFEGQINTGKMVSELVSKIQKNGIKILNNISVESFSESGNVVEVKTDKITFKTNKLFIATNGFANKLLNEKVQPARAQVLITKPIKNLQIKGTFHLDKGYYYFRNIDDRILFGGGRNLDFKTEQTTEFGETEIIQNELERILKTTILPNTNVEIEHRWSGIMGVGNQKKAIVKQLSNNVFFGVRLGGMGIAIGSLIGKELAELID
ncbi:MULTISPECIES: NAD(P)/FAD-dependent oxidoreductase [Tenacibaculum]|uniref:NAD(P)/FAD-dependent oxidoreductase n=1 Tax=Tenacibaculum TaxID=104267 RepID=UPI001F0A2192|nr:MULTISPECIES: FAD-dependent oxidoreductase [Tenacibaculum]MCH3881309.1 FAD-binding oxidoreductase [Tenacibaculum aquimarinum]MDO6599097.1 FAD-dependent oxidoreductase [Tenacibaculum sp. 1_MG-2023]